MVHLGTLNRHHLEISGRTGLLAGAFANGLSFQPNLVPRGSRAQALISGIAAATAFGWTSSSHSFLRSMTNRIPGAAQDPVARAISGLVVDGAVAVGCGIATRALRPRETDRAGRAIARLTAAAMTTSALAGLSADLLELWRDKPGNRVGTAVATAVAWGAGYAIARSGEGGVDWLPHASGSAPEPTSGGSTRVSPEDLAAVDLTMPPEEGGGMKEEPPQVVVPAAAAAGLAVTGALLGLTWVESRLSSLAAGGAARAIGGTPDDTRTLGRALVWAAVGGLGWWGFTRVNAALTAAGTGPDLAHVVAPNFSEVTGGPGSVIPWSAQSRESRRWLTMTLTAAEIEAVMGERARQPIRVYAALESAATPAERAALLLAEIDRTEALRRPVFALFSPTGSGYVNYVASETLEYLTRGACASAAIQYSVLPSALSLTHVAVGAAQTRAVINGVVDRLLDMAPEERPRFFLFGESLGAHVSQEIFAGQGIAALDGIGLEAAVWVGTPAASRWRSELWHDRPLDRAPDLGPGAAYLTRYAGDWVGLSPEQRARIQYLFLDNGNDPVPKFDVPLLWRRPAWLATNARRPPGAPRDTVWIPITTFFTTFVDLQNSLRPVPGRFVQGGHDYRRLLPDVVRTVYGLEAELEQMARVQAALRERELTWEVRRRYAAARVKPEEERATALAALAERVSRWTGAPPDLDHNERLELVRRLVSGSHRN